MCQPTVTSGISTFQTVGINQTYSLQNFGEDSIVQTRILVSYVWEYANSAIKSKIVVISDKSWYIKMYVMIKHTIIYESLMNLYVICYQTQMPCIFCDIFFRYGTVLPTCPTKQSRK